MKRFTCGGDEWSLDMEVDARSKLSARSWRIADHDGREATRTSKYGLGLWLFSYEIELWVLEPDRKVVGGDVGQQEMSNTLWYDV